MDIVDVEAAISWECQQVDSNLTNYNDYIDRLRKTGDAAGHKTDPCGAGNDHFFCPTGTGPKDITARIKSSIIP